MKLAELIMLPYNSSYSETILELAQVWATFASVLNAAVHFPIAHVTTRELFSAAEPQELVVTGLVNSVIQMATSVAKVGLAVCVKADKLHTGCKVSWSWLSKICCPFWKLFLKSFGMAPNSKRKQWENHRKTHAALGLLTWFHHIQAKVFWIAPAIKAGIWMVQTTAHLQGILSLQNCSLWLLQLGHCSDSTMLYGTHGTLLCENHSSARKTSSAKGRFLGAWRCGMWCFFSAGTASRPSLSPSFGDVFEGRFWMFLFIFMAGYLRWKLGFEAVLLQRWNSSCWWSHYR